MLGAWRRGPEALLTYLLVGSVIYRMVVDGHRQFGGWCLAASVVIFVFTHSAYVMLHGDSGGVDLGNGGFALLIFFVAMFGPARWRLVDRPLRWIADISYPLYLIHIPLAWIVLAWLASHGWGMLPASIATGAVILLAAWAIHVVVEEPARKIGKAISRSRDPQEAIARATARTARP